MKKITIILFFFPFILKAQTADSTKDISVQENTGGVWNIEMLGVNKKNTPAKNAYWLQKAIDKIHIKEIVVTSDSANTEFLLGNNINLKGKTLVFKNGCSINGSKAITLDSAVVDGNYNDKMFGININLTNPKTSGKYFSVNWLGLKALGVSGPNNDRAVIRKFKDLHKLNLIFPGPAGYLVDTTFFIHRDNNLDQSNSKLIVNNSWRGVGLQIGDSLLTYRPYGGVWNVRVENSVFAPTFTAADTNHIGVLIVNAEEVEDVNIINVNGFYNAFVLRGHNNGCVGNNIKVTKTNNSINHIVIENKGSGWVNGNALYVSHVRNQSGFNLSLRTTAITIGNPNYRWICEGNRIIGGVYELNNTSLGRLCYIRFGMSNELRLDYLEANGNIAMYVGTNPQNANNHVYLGHTSGPAQELKSDSGVFAGNSVRSARSLALTDNFSPIYNIPDLSAITAVSNALGSISIGGGLNAVATYIYGRVLDSLGSAYWEDGYLVLDKISYAIGTGHINTEDCKEFVVRANTKKGFEGKIHIKQYDSLGNIINNGNFMDRVKATNTSYWDAGYFGGSWEVGVTSRNYNGDIRFIVSDRCKRIQVFFKAGSSAPLKIRGFYIGAADFGHVPVYANIGTAIRVRQQPTIGNYEAGMEMVDFNTTKSKMWKVLRSGTLRKNLLIANLTYTNNNNKVYIDVHNDSVQVGDWLQVGLGDPRRVIGKKGTDTLIMDNVVSGTGTAAISFAAPLFLEIREGGNSRPGREVNTTENDYLAGSIDIDTSVVVGKSNIKFNEKYIHFMYTKVKGVVSYTVYANVTGISATSNRRFSIPFTSFPITPNGTMLGGTIIGSSNTGSCLGYIYDNRGKTGFFWDETGTYTTVITATGHYTTD